jgi:hypothetical protein
MLDAALLEQCTVYDEDVKNFKGIYFIIFIIYSIYREE